MLSECAESADGEGERESVDGAAALPGDEIAESVDDEDVDVDGSEEISIGVDIGSGLLSLCGNRSDVFERYLQSGPLS